MAFPVEFSIEVKVTRNTFFIAYRCCRACFQDVASTTIWSHGLSVFALAVCFHQFSLHGIVDAETCACRGIRKALAKACSTLAFSVIFENDTGRFAIDFIER